MKEITKEMYENLINSDENMYAHAISLLPDYYKQEYEAVYKRREQLEDKFMKVLNAINPELAELYLEIDDANGNYITARMDAVFLYGVLADHKKLRFQGWRVPLNDDNMEGEK